jgi:hypothetical protein
VELILKKYHSVFDCIFMGIAMHLIPKRLMAFSRPTPSASNPLSEARAPSTHPEQTHRTHEIPTQRDQPRARDKVRGRLNTVLPKALRSGQVRPASDASVQSGSVAPPMLAHSEVQTRPSRLRRGVYNPIDTPTASRNTALDAAPQNVSHWFKDPAEAAHYQQAWEKLKDEPNSQGFLNLLQSLRKLPKDVRKELGRGGVQNLLRAVTENESLRQACYHASCSLAYVGKGVDVNASLLCYHQLQHHTELAQAHAQVQVSLQKISVTPGSVHAQAQYQKDLQHYFSLVTKSERLEHLKSSVHALFSASPSTHQFMGTVSDLHWQAWQHMDDIAGLGHHVCGLETKHVGTRQTKLKDGFFDRLSNQVLMVPERQIIERLAQSPAIQALMNQHSSAVLHEGSQGHASPSEKVHARLVERTGFLRADQDTYLAQKNEKDRTASAHFRGTHALYYTRAQAMGQEVSAWFHGEEKIQVERAWTKFDTNPSEAKNFATFLNYVRHLAGGHRPELQHKMREILCRMAADSVFRKEVLKVTQNLNLLYSDFTKNELNHGRQASTETRWRGMLQQATWHAFHQMVVLERIEDIRAHVHQGQYDHNEPELMAHALQQFRAISLAEKTTQANRAMNEVDRQAELHDMKTMKLLTYGDYWSSQWDDVNAVAKDHSTAFRLERALNESLDLGLPTWCMSADAGQPKVCQQPNRDRPNAEQVAAIGEQVLQFRPQHFMEFAVQWPPLQDYILRKHPEVFSSLEASQTPSRIPGMAQRQRGQIMYELMGNLFLEHIATTTQNHTYPLV